MGGAHTDGIGRTRPAEPAITGRAPNSDRAGRAGVGNVYRAGRTQSSAVDLDRNPYVDLVRVVSICAVALGHWLLTDITYRGGRLSGADALSSIQWGQWVTLILQVIPAFFLAGGYSNAVSWTAHHARGEVWTVWVRGRATPILWAVAVYVATTVLAVVVADAAGTPSVEIVRAAWFTALHLWFVPVYLLMIALTPIMFAAHRRWGLAVPLAMAIGATAVDVAVIGFHLPLIGFANYLLVWGSSHQWGFAWQTGTLIHPRWRPYALGVGGAMLLAGLLVWGPFPVDMIGTGQRIDNTSPPSVVLLAFAAAQAGLLLAAEPGVTRLLTRSGTWRLIRRLNTAVLTVYLWHMVPVIIVAIALYPTGFVAQPAIGTALWWALRPAWIAVLTAVLIPLTAAVMWAERPLRNVPVGVGPWWRGSPAVLAVGLTVAAAGLSRFAIAGFAPSGDPAVIVLAVYICGLVFTQISGRSPAGSGRASHIL